MTFFNVPAPQVFLHAGSHCLAPVDDGSESRIMLLTKNQQRMVVPVESRILNGAAQKAADLKYYQSQLGSMYYSIRPIHTHDERAGRVVSVAANGLGSVLNKQLLRLQAF